MRHGDTGCGRPSARQRTGREDAESAPLGRESGVVAWETVRRVPGTVTSDPAGRPGIRRHPARPPRISHQAPRGAGRRVRTGHQGAASPRVPGRPGGASAETRFPKLEPWRGPRARGHRPRSVPASRGPAGSSARFGPAGPPGLRSPLSAVQALHSAPAAWRVGAAAEAPARPETGPVAAAGLEGGHPCTHGPCTCMYTRAHKHTMCMCTRVLVAHTNTPTHMCAQCTNASHAHTSMHAGSCAPCTHACTNTHKHSHAHTASWTVAGTCWVNKPAELVGTRPGHGGHGLPPAWLNSARS